MKTQQSYAKNQLGTLYLVPTPIGNLDDMTFRAVQTLKDVDLIACEDTRMTQKLLNHFEIDTTKVSYHEHNVHAQTNELIRELLDGKNIAQVSDAGMPSISDPGVELVAAAVAQNIPVVPLPGANAALTALIASGLAPQPFTFYGFLSRKKSELNEELNHLKDKTETLMFYESPHRLVRFLKELVNVFGEERKIVLARELTKRYEEFVRGTAKEVLDWADKTELRGEFVVLVAGNEEVEEENYWENWTVLEHIEYKMTYEKLSSKEAIKLVAKERGVPKREVYAEYHQK
ncbi:MAG TPA: 16S rRNA (cytidine(1402)-2'-O)-methyltransferase [Candidatus Atopostipes pullistercoris]|uniref:Ribosomal RNA small subunit methyltransferase I n=1 Tax=Candidatus Atopostipes pullistercoris TaxID=2838467 RepID=A0A9D2FZF3_9LACT|nr:16S rRNA (cytidine(1402)-2'-O)-methyltransferase [Candidatus Atopostipes pullistercoris]